MRRLALTIAIGATVSALNAAPSDLPTLIRVSDSKSLAPDPAVVAAIKAAAPYAGNLFPVRDRVEFDQQVLKVDVLTFQQGATLVLTAVDKPWIAVVAKELKYTGNPALASILVENSLVAPLDGQEWPRLAKPPRQRKGGRVGRRGTDGTNGQQGNSPESTPMTPHLYLVAGKVSVENGAPPPNYSGLTIENDGVDGGAGGNGQDGQAGGDGGDGQDGKRNFLRVSCSRNPGSGGPGGNGGVGGSGHDGGPGANGGNVSIGGSDQSIGVLDFAAFYLNRGDGGVPGIGAKNGIGGKGGARGARPGVCRGGSGGPSGKTPTDPTVSGTPGQAGNNGLVFHWPVDVNTLW